MQTKFFSFLLGFFCLYSPIKAQTDTISLTLKDVIEMARRQSLNAFIAKNTYLEGYWQFKTYRADLYPSLWLNSNVVTYDSGNKWISATQEYDYRQETTNNIGLSLRQNIVPTGGEISLNSKVYRNHNINDGELSYRTNPIDITITQPLSGYNQIKWNRKLEPLNYEIIKKSYLQSQQSIARQTVNQFFRLASAELVLAISEFNYSNADTLYRIGTGRFEIGTITQDELLNLELTRLNAEKSLTSASLSLQRAKANLNSFLRLPKEVEVKCVLPEEIPKLQIEVDKAVDLAFENNPDILNNKRDLIIQDRNVAEARSKRFGADLVLSYGIDQVAYDIDEMYSPPYSNSNLASVGLNVPLVDWGNTRGQFLMAKSRREITKYEVEQSIVDFEQNVTNTVIEFNLQEQQLKIAQKAEEVGKLGFEVTKQRFLIGKVDVLRLNEARTGMENSRISYIENLQSYWDYIFYIQILTLYDFIDNKVLEADFEKIVQDQQFD